MVFENWIQFCIIIIIILIFNIEYNYIFMSFLFPKVSISSLDHNHLLILTLKTQFRLFYHRIIFNNGILFNINYLLLNSSSITDSYVQWKPLIGLTVN